MAETILYGTRLSPFVEKVARALALKKVPYRLVPPASPMDLRKWNPQTGKIPVIELGGERLWDSTFILARLDERFPDPPLFSADPAVAAAQRLLEDWSDESLYWYVMALRWTKKNAPASVSQIVAGLSPFIRPMARLVLPRQIGRLPWAQGLGRLPDAVLVRELGHRLDDLVTLLGRRAYFHADAASAAELALYGQFSTMRSGPTPEAERLLDDRPALADFMKRVEEATGG